MKKKCLLCFGAAVIIAACAKEETPVIETPEVEETAVTEEGLYVPGVSIVKLSQELSDLIGDDLESGKAVTRSAGLNQALEGLGAVSIRRVFDIGGEYEPRQRKAGLDRFYEVVYSKDTPLTRASAELESVDGVEMVERRRRIVPKSYFNDTYAGEQWDLYNDGSVSGRKAGIDINVVPVWRDFHMTGNSDVIVGIIDGGIDPDHPDLIANSIPGGEGGSRNFVDSSFTIYAHDHGSHVAGTVAAVSNNGVGVSGIAGGDYANGVPGVRLMSCQVFKDVDGVDVEGDFLNAIIWAADHGAVIINNSWGYLYDLDGDWVISDSELEIAASTTIYETDKAAVDYFIQYAGCDNDGNQLPDSPMKGGVVTFAAGNDAIPYGAPADYEPVIGISSIGANGSRAYYSTFGDWVDICAPGGSEEGYILSTIPGGGYDYYQGTSMACPHVTGVAALIVSYFGGQGFTNEMLKERLLKGANADPVNPAEQIGPLLDAYGAFTYGDTTAPDPVTALTGSADLNFVTLRWEATADNGIRTYSYRILYSKDRSLLEGADPMSLPDNVFAETALNDGADAGDELDFTVEELEFGQEYYFAIVASDYQGNCSRMSDILRITIQENNHPVITTSYEGDYNFMAYENLTIPFEVYDLDGHEVTVSFASGSLADRFVKADSRNYSLTINAPKADAGDYTAVITATDGYDETRYEINYTIMENAAPVLTKECDGFILKGKGETFTLDLSEYINDPDGESLAYTISVENNLTAFASTHLNTLTCTALGYGMTEMTVTASDAKGLSCQLTFKVGVIDPADPVSVYPNPVRETLYVTPGEEATAAIEILSAAGSSVFETSRSCSVLHPASIDMSGFAPGKYIVKVTAEGKSAVRNITKL